MDAKSKTPSLTAAAPVVKNIGTKEITEYLELKAQRAELEAKARVIERQERTIAGEIVAYVTKHGGKNRTVKRCGHQLSIVAKPGSVAWLAEFQKLAGPARVEELKAAAPKRDSLVVLKAA